MSRVYTSAEMMQIKNILGLAHDNWQPSPERTEVYKKMRATKKRSITRCATELKEAGIKFKSVEGRNLFNIRFEKGKIKIPKIQITDRTECVLQNLVAYEQLPFASSKYFSDYVAFIDSLKSCCLRAASFRNSKYFSDYVAFIDSLIDSAKDVKLLCPQGIIDDWKGDEESIDILFNKLGEHVFYNRALYGDIVNNVNEHCKKRKNLWIAKLRHDYFQSPWFFISVVAAVIPG